MRKRNRLVKRTILYLVLAIFVIVALFPIYWMLNTSLKPNNDLSDEANLFPK